MEKHDKNRSFKISVGYWKKALLEKPEFRTLLEGLIFTDSKGNKVRGMSGFTDGILGKADDKEFITVSVEGGSPANHVRVENMFLEMAKGELEDLRGERHQIQQRLAGIAREIKQLDEEIRAAAMEKVKLNELDLTLGLGKGVLLLFGLSPVRTISWLRKVDRVV